MAEETLGANVAALSMMLGRWTGEETVHPAAGMPGQAKVSVENKPALGGAVIVHDYVQTRDGGDVFHGHAVIRLDGEAGEYVMHWFDGSGSHTPFRGRLAERVLEFVSESEDFTGRCRFEFTENGASYDFKMEVAVGGGPWAPYVDGCYAKQAA